MVFYVFARNRGVPGKGLLLWMISTPNGVASFSQAQIVLWTFLIGALCIYVMALSGVLIDITDSTLVLLGISGIAVVSAKLQNSQQDAKGTTQTDGTTAVPGKVLSLLQVGDPTDSEVRLAWMPPTTGGPVAGYMVEYPKPAHRPTLCGAWSAKPSSCRIILSWALRRRRATKFRVRAVNAGGHKGDHTEQIGPIQTQPQVGPSGGHSGPNRRPAHHRRADANQCKAGVVAGRRHADQHTRYRTVATIPLRRGPKWATCSPKTSRSVRWMAWPAALPLTSE